MLPLEFFATSNCSNTSPGSAGEEPVIKYRVTVFLAASVLSVFSGRAGASGVSGATGVSAGAPFLVITKLASL